jgi:prepilin peptidase CpaA
VTLLAFSPALNMILASASVALLGAAAWHDAVARTIPNGIPAALALIAVLALLLSPAPWHGLFAASLVFSAALLLWRFGLLGGGDAKLLGAIGLLVAPDRIGGTVTMIALAGGLLTLPYLACRGRIARPAPVRPTGLVARALRAERFRLRRGGPLPYAIAIAIGTTFGLLGGPP